MLGSAVSLASLGTVATAVIAGVFATWVFDVDLLGGLIIGSAIAASDSAAIFAVFADRACAGSLARTLEGESGMNDPIAVLLVVGFIDWIQIPDYGAVDMALELAIKLSIGLAAGIVIGIGARAAFRRLDLPSPGLYPVASLATAALAFGVAEVAHGSGFLSVYIAALTLGTGPIPARGSTIAFHQGMSWTAQISLFFLLGLLVFPSGLGDIAAEGLALSAVLIFVARPLAAVIATAFSPFDMKERLMLGWAGLRGAIPIWLATFPVIAEVQSAELIFNAIFFVVVTSTLIQGATFNPLAVQARPDDERAGGAAYRGRDRHRAPARRRCVHLCRQARRRGRRSAGPRARLAARGTREPDRAQGRSGSAARLDRDPGRRRAARARAPRGDPSRHRAHRALGDRAARRAGAPAPSAPSRAAGLHRASPDRRRRRPRAGPRRSRAPPSPRACASAATRPGRWSPSPTGATPCMDAACVAVGGRGRMAEWVARRVRRPGLSPAERAWWEEVAGALNTPVPRTEADRRCRGTGRGAYRSEAVCPAPEPATRRPRLRRCAGRRLPGPGRRRRPSPPRAGRRRPRRP